MMPPFSQFREYLASDEYRAAIKKLVGETNAPPRSEWPVDVSHLARMHNELGNQLLRAAVDHFRKERELIAEHPAAG